MRSRFARWRRRGNSLALAWTLITFGLVVMLWVSGFRAWPVYLTAAPSAVVSVLLWVGAVRTRRRGTGPEPVGKPSGG
ncbi:hypothetical protein [Amycolatopsis regifaucium]|uniref:Uncharacterized protein n=1 Tax=Amycolatopsis regifaucium TaxID=546365 RepID=A0A154MSM5_9PSEU|nr:hypothetical protein [Amycolatopsis regifaucium]KZB86983.1 hypothetical protein AVL48_25475 [Amycolatopsis regifaucium]OKA09412.1 hypothetical protein ATP06_0208030 [Amycolatopsis regifaucium]SFH60493.1 hypothetical protein SAMN04489731_105222 [Amycolatopsis regifaucium]